MLSLSKYGEREIRTPAPENFRPTGLANPPLQPLGYLSLGLYFNKGLPNQPILVLESQNLILIMNDLIQEPSYDVVEGGLKIMHGELVRKLKEILGNQDGKTEKEIVRELMSAISKLVPDYLLNFKKLRDDELDTFDWHYLEALHTEPWLQTMWNLQKIIKLVLRIDLFKERFDFTKSKIMGKLLYKYVSRHGLLRSIVAGLESYPLPRLNASKYIDFLDEPKFNSDYSIENQSLIHLFDGYLKED